MVRVLAWKASTFAAFFHPSQMLKLLVASHSLDIVPKICCLVVLFFSHIKLQGSIRCSWVFTPSDPSQRTKVFDPSFHAGEHEKSAPEVNVSVVNESGNTIPRHGQRLAFFFVFFRATNWLMMVVSWW